MRDVQSTTNPFAENRVTATGMGLDKARLFGVVDERDAVVWQPDNARKAKPITAAQNARVKKTALNLCSERTVVT